MAHRSRNKSKKRSLTFNFERFLMLTKPLHLDVHEQIECAHTLASRFYTDPTILEIEKTRIFQRAWQMVGTLSQPCGEVNGEASVCAHSICSCTSRWRSEEH